MYPPDILIPPPPYPQLEAFFEIMQSVIVMVPPVTKIPPPESSEVFDVISDVVMVNDLDV